MSANFDAEAFHAALDSQRLAMGMTWKDVAAEAGVSASTLTRMAQGKRPDVDGLAALLQWSGLQAEMFIRKGKTEGKKQRNRSRRSPPFCGPQSLSKGKRRSHRTDSQGRIQTVPEERTMSLRRGFKSRANQISARLRRSQGLPPEAPIDLAIIAARLKIEIVPLSSFVAEYPKAVRQLADRHRRLLSCDAARRFQQAHYRS